VNVSKPQILTNVCLQESCFAEVAGDFIDLLRGEHRQNIFGKHFIGLGTHLEFDH
jgi:hypothetical protein